MLYSLSHIYSFKSLKVLKKWSVREREHFYQRDSAYPVFNRQRIVTPGKNGTSGHPVPNPSGAEVTVSDR